MEISRKALGITVIVLLLAAVGTPFLFAEYPNDNKGVDLELSYRLNIESFSTQEGHRSTQNVTVLSFSLCLNNISEVLSNESLWTYPIWLNVSDWSLGAEVWIRGLRVDIVDDQSMYGFDCWKVEKNDETSLYYSKKLGFLIYSIYSDSGVGVFPETWSSSAEWTLIASNIYELNSTIVSVEGWLIAGILTQLTIVIGLFEYRRSRTD